jgi:hypothetical protein
MLEAADSEQRRRFGFWLGLGAELFARDVSWVVEGGAGWRWPASRVLVDLRFRTGTPTTAGSSPDDVSRWASRVTGRVGLASRGGPSFEGFVGSGLSVSRLELESVPDAPVRMAVSPVFEAGLGLEVGGGGVFDGRVEASCALFVLQESYQLAPAGEVGEGPRYSCGILGGVAWGRVSGPARTAGSGRDVAFH